MNPSTHTHLIICPRVHGDIGQSELCLLTLLQCEMCANQCAQCVRALSMLACMFVCAVQGTRQNQSEVACEYMRRRLVCVSSPCAPLGVGNMAALLHQSETVGVVYTCVFSPDTSRPTESTAMHSGVGMRGMGPVHSSRACT